MPLKILPYVGNQQVGSPGIDLLKNIGTGLGEGLQRLAQHKMQKMHKENQISGWQSAGVPRADAEFILSQPEWLQKELVDRLDFNKLNNQSSDQMPSPVAQSLGQGQNKPSSSIFGSSSKQKEQQAKQYKETAEIRSKIISDRKTARSELQDLNLMEELNQSGKLDTPGYVEFLKRSGLDLPSLLSPESEQFQKIEKGFLKNIGAYFKGSISNNEINQFLQTIPTLSQSPQGRKRVISMLKMGARLKDEYYKTMTEVLRDNGNVPPYDLEEQIEARIDPKIEKVSRMFKEDLSKPVPKGQNKAITALQSGAGSLIGNIGKGVLGAGAGAIAGGKLGVLGSVPGAVLGGLAGLTGFGSKGAS